MSLGPFAGPLRVRQRRFEPGPYVTGLARGPGAYDPAVFPFSLPVFATLEALGLDAPVTMFSGDNGTGKSTVLESIAWSMGFREEGGEYLHVTFDGTELPAVPQRLYEDALTPTLTLAKPERGFFLRAESFYNVARGIDSGAPGALHSSRYGEQAMHEQSHGESFLALAANRFGANGLYVLDEPEAALSVTGALALLAIVARAAGEGAQFIIATHSPILLACPGARIYEFSENGFEVVAYDDLEVVRLYRSFLGAPERYLRAIDPAG